MGCSTSGLEHPQILSAIQKFNHVPSCNYNDWNNATIMKNHLRNISREESQLTVFSGKNCRCTEITPNFIKNLFPEVQMQFWTKNIDPTADEETLEKLHRMELLYLPSTNQNINSKNKFWSSFASSLNANPKGIDYS
ncbi:hypothetical protein RclHR1_00590033 [Rhizophagus clarus]|uniref:Uncharacterized protein n=1 Tax=Rhizophagus clarus TaxID=94130 RepID=A0A2Z6SGT1_9GLOM|nr:hypothetical protein RclHR1_00590033 [Rhizophagus clarus]GES92493.1 hypothetical protein RCL_jg28825.t1 [Rhizophagus clarus]